MDATKSDRLGNKSFIKQIAILRAKTKKSSTKKELLGSNPFGIPRVMGAINPSAVTGGVICIRSMHNRKKTALHTIRIVSGIDLCKVV